MTRHTFILIALILSAASASAQIELTADDFANEGDGYIYAVKYYQTDDDIYISDLESKKWNLADIEPETFDTLRIYKKERSRYGKLFPNAQLVKFHSRRDMVFITKDSNSISMQGMVNDYLGLKAAVMLIFPQDLDLYKFPIKQGTFLKDSLSHALNIIKRHTEELLPRIYLVDAAILQSFVQRRLQPDSIF